MSHHSARFFVGTSGYSYTEWITSGFYPPGTKNNQMLSIYAKTFLATELNYTWYQMPKAEMVERQRQLVPADFKFAAKLTRTLTHEVDAGTWKKEAASFRAGISPLQQGDQLAAVLIQLPPSFDYSPSHRAYLGALLHELEGLPLAVEFRNPGWIVEKVFRELAGRKVSLVTADEPKLSWLFPTLDIVTNPDLVYIRFHGRNAKGWGRGNMNLQFDYQYTQSELEEWINAYIPKLTLEAKAGLVFFNNHVRGQAVSNAVSMRSRLKEHGIEAV